MCSNVSCTISEITLHEIIIVVFCFLDQTLPLCAPNDTVHCLFPSYGECLVILDIILRFSQQAKKHLKLFLLHRLIFTDLIKASLIGNFFRLGKKIEP